MRDLIVIIRTDCLLVALGLSSSVLVRLIGDLFVSELIILLVVPFLLLTRGRQLLRPELKWVFSLLGIWLVAQVLTDAYRQIDLPDRMRGMAAILFFGMEVAAFAILLAKSNRHRVVFLTAYAIGSIIMSRIQPSRFAEIDPWKFGYATGVIDLAVLISCTFYARRKYISSMLVLVGIMIVNLLLNTRSLFLELFVATVLIFPIIPDQIGRLRILPKNGNLLRVSILVILALGAAWSANKVVHLVTRSGFLSNEATAKNESESQAGNLLLGGRPEFFVGVRAVMDSPIIGHGSWAKDMKYIEMQYDLMQEYGVGVDLKDVEAQDLGLIPAHSHIVGAWVSAGILGATFWGYAIWLVIRALVVTVINRPPLAPMYASLLIGFLWNLLFSPFGSVSRMIEAFILVIAVILLEKNAKPATFGFLQIERLPRTSPIYSRINRKWRN